MFDFEALVRGRRSVRRILPTPIPRALVMEAVSLAQLAPSNSNIQPWRRTHRELGAMDAVGVGMYLQTLVLGLAARGIGSCVQAALTTCPEVLRRELPIPDELEILCGLSLGTRTPTFPPTTFRYRGGPWRSA